MYCVVILFTQANATVKISGTYGPFEDEDSAKAFANKTNNMKYDFTRAIVCPLESCG
jgi:hypothetical protein